MTRTSHILAVLSLLAICGFSTPAVAASYAIIVGHNGVPEGIEGLTNLRYADDDAARWASVLERIGEVHLLTVLDTESQRAHPGLAAKTKTPTMRNFAAAVDAVRQSIERDAANGEDPTVYFVYSGHGAHTADGKPFLTLQDGELGRNGLYEQIGALPAARTHMIIDACHAAAIVGARGGFFDEESDADTVDTAEVLDQLAAPPELENFPHVGVLLSASAGESSHEWSEVRSGVFTHELLSAVLGPADINVDGRVEYSEVAAYIAAAHREVDDPRAVPTVVARAPAVDARTPIVHVDQLGPAVVGNADGFGRFAIETKNGVRWAEGHLTGDQLVRIVLPRSVAYLTTSAGEAELPETGADLELAALKPDEPRQSAKGVDAAFRRGLFAAPFGADYYRGYVDANDLIGVDWPATTKEEPPTEPDEATTEPKPKRTVEEQSVASGSPRSWWPTVTLWTLSAAGVTAGTMSLATASKARRDFEASETQRDGHEAADRYDANRNRAIMFYGLGVVSGIAGTLLMPKKPREISLQVLADGTFFVSLQKSW